MHGHHSTSSEHDGVVPLCSQPQLPPGSHFMQRRLAMARSIAGSTSVAGTQDGPWTELVSQQEFSSPRVQPAWRLVTCASAPRPSANCAPGEPAAEPAGSALQQTSDRCLHKQDSPSSLPPWPASKPVLWRAANLQRHGVSLTPGGPTGVSMAVDKCTHRVPVPLPLVAPALHQRQPQLPGGCPRRRRP